MPMRIMTRVHVRRRKKSPESLAVSRFLCRRIQNLVITINKVNARNTIMSATAVSGPIASGVVKQDWVSLGLFVSRQEAMISNPQEMVRLAFKGSGANKVYIKDFRASITCTPTTPPWQWEIVQESTSVSLVLWGEIGFSLEYFVGLGDLVCVPKRPEKRPTCRINLWCGRRLVIRLAA